MRIVFAGTPAVAVPALTALLASEHEVLAVVTRPDAPAGRGRRLVPSPVAECAEAAGVEVIRTSRPKDPAFQARLAELAPDCCPVVAYGALIPPVALDIPKYGWINLHFSLLPAWRGAAPVQHAVLHGDQVTGAVTFQLEAGMDTGPVYQRLTEPIRPTDTSGQLLERLAHSGAELLVSTLDQLAAGGLTPQPQPETGVSHAPKLTVEDGRVDWSATAERIDRQVRACTPAPGGWTLFRGERLKLAPVDLRPDAPTLAPGQLSTGRDGVLVGTGSHPVALGEVQAQGKRRMAAGDWARGVRLEPTETLG